MTRRIPVLVTVDTEEDNWFPAREGITVRNIHRLDRLQALLDRHGLVATLLTTWQVADDDAAMDVVLGLAREHGAEVGTHLHPWNTPPYEAPFDPRAVSLRALPASEQEAKLAALTTRLHDRLGARPRSFRAGRWSFDAGMATVLRNHGYEADSSVLPYLYWYDVSDSPDFPRAPEHPWLMDGRRDVQEPAASGLVALPPTIGFSRWPWRRWAALDRALQHPAARALHATGLLARTGVVEKLALTPEVNGHERMLELARLALANGVPALNLFLHSGAFDPGWTPYVSTRRDLQRFLDTLDRFLDGLRALGEPEGITMAALADRLRPGLEASAAAEQSPQAGQHA